jgi:hypothetical protein
MRGAGTMAYVSQDAILTGFREPLHANAIRAAVFLFRERVFFIFPLGF